MRTLLSFLLCLFPVSPAPREFGQVTNRVKMRQGATQNRVIDTGYEARNEWI